MYSDLSSRYKDSVKRLRRQALDTPMSGLQCAIWWTEYIIRNKGAKHLRSPTADLPVYQYWLLDVMSFLLLGVVFCVGASLLGIVIVKKICNIIWNAFKNIIKRKKQKNT
ncbi:hypothetical protein NQ318_021877, partial [Aromia moschata]